jgi:predicted phage gp36 major capsid-like protein
MLILDLRKTAVLALTLFAAGAASPSPAAAQFGGGRWQRVEQPYSPGPYYRDGYDRRAERRARRRDAGRGVARPVQPYGGYYVYPPAGQYYAGQQYREPWRSQPYGQSPDWESQKGR